MKTRWQDLAIETNVPAFPERLHVGRPNVGDEERLFERFREILGRRYFTNNGPFVQELESRVAEYVGVRHCVAMCNATIALEIATRALGLSGEVVVPSLTFTAALTRSAGSSASAARVSTYLCDASPSVVTT